MTSTFKRTMGGATLPPLKTNNNNLNRAATYKRRRKMKNDFLSYKKADFDGTNNQNLVFEMMGLCISNGTRIIVEQEEEAGLRYLMLDISPTDGSNIECDIYSMCGLVCVVTSIENEDEGKIYEAFTNYLEAFQWLVDFIGKGDFTEIYIETY